ncbi:uncharacterized protein AB675_3792 [Cyphellophora attinorum]|uniref:Oxidative stress-induced growth inhibitor 1 n=1 Tax=Cyphellophora attinorum TaxID=1664694 RepID=A0A0N0NI04_9EURO|nr:uncharacterized protein AB675_3792 [Phialophora attinorum]KPI35281.1 hypothetical protein AB675_3792 [Phialophora attinorum]
MASPRTLPREVDTLIVGNGPSALILSYILHGHIPVYDVENPHPDSILHEKLRHTSNLVDLDVDHFTEHFLASRYSYSTQALPVNVLLDALIRPYGESEGTASCVKWEYDPSRAVSHAIVGDTHDAGGQWVDNPVQASWDIGTLSYAGMLSLPGYTFAEHYENHHGEPLPFYMRPTRREVAGYFAAYPSQAGISDSVYNDVRLSDISRTEDGFFVQSHGLKCRHLVLATGIFSELIPPRPLLQPLKVLPPLPPTPTKLPLLVIGSGFSAADIIISSSPAQKLMHIFKWDPAHRPSPLRACHADSYPEYAGVYKRMKLAALSPKASRDRRPKPHRTRSTTFDLNRNWDQTYEGLPNTEIIAVDVSDCGSEATLKLRNSAGEVHERHISAMAYVVGRRGSLDYLSRDLKSELVPELSQSGDLSLITGQTLREKANEDMEVAPDVFIIGSLTGDSLIRFSYGSCAHTAGKIMSRSNAVESHGNLNGTAILANGNKPSPKKSVRDSPRVPAMNGFDGHTTYARRLSEQDLEHISTR